jgi:hypothetical protein
MLAAALTALFFRGIPIALAEVTDAIQSDSDE